jgi:curved DNA-binding protein CbpA
MMNVYRLLGVAPSVNFGQLRLAYKEAARRVHPDVASGDVRRFQALQAAWGLVSTRELRAKYDLERAAWAKAVEAVLCQVCGEANRLTNRPEDYAAVLCGGCRGPLSVEKARTRTTWRVSERNRRLLLDQTCDLIDTIEDEAILAMGNALAAQVRRLRRRLTGV